VVPERCAIQIYDFTFSKDDQTTRSQDQPVAVRQRVTSQLINQE